jgi:hypothetical protein
MIIRLADYSRSKLPNGMEAPRSSLRGLNHPLRTEAQVLSLRAARQAAEPVSRPCDSEPSGDVA